VNTPGSLRGYLCSESIVSQIEKVIKRIVQYSTHNLIGRLYADQRSGQSRNQLDSVQRMIVGIVAFVMPQAKTYVDVKWKVLPMPIEVTYDVIGVGRGNYHYAIHSTFCSMTCALRTL
jgi:hypothetical protein